MSETISLTHPSKASHQTRASKLSTIEAKAAALRTELQYQAIENQLADEEFQRKVKAEHDAKEFEKRKTAILLQKELDSANAQIAVLKSRSSNGSQRATLDLPTDPNMVKNYVERHALKTVPPTMDADKPDRKQLDTSNNPDQEIKSEVENNPDLEIKTEVEKKPDLTEVKENPDHERKIEAKQNLDQEIKIDVQENLVKSDAIPTNLKTNDDRKKISAQTKASQTIERQRPDLQRTTPFFDRSYYEVNPEFEQFLRENLGGYQPEGIAPVSQRLMYSNPPYRAPTPDPGPSATDLGGLARVIAEQCNMMKLPPPEPSVFSGNPLEYNMWKRSFELLIENKDLRSSEKLYYLQKYLSGPAKECVKGFLLEDSTGSYTSAKARLDIRFGDHFVIAAAFKRKLKEWPKLASDDPSALQRFSDFLNQCQCAKRDNINLRILDDCDTNAALLSKLPQTLIKSWSRIVYSCKASTSMYPGFDQFVNFVEKEAMIASDPVISGALYKGKDSTQSSSKLSSPKEKRQSFVIEATNSKSEARNSRHSEGNTAGNTPRRPCFRCSHDHHLDNCPDFLKLSLPEKRAYAETNKLCFACLNQRHVAKHCKRRKWCKVCQKPHPTSLHDDKWRRVETVCNFTSSITSNKKCTMIIPVFVSHASNEAKEFLVYALLDTQSDATFMTENLRQKLGVDGTTTLLQLSTLASKDKLLKCRKVSDLHVRGHNSDKTIPIHAAFTRDAIPANRQHIPSPSIVAELPHLSKMAHELMERSDAEIGLLIGYDCPRAFTPREIITAPNQEIFAQRTDLGWGVMGTFECSSSNDHSVMYCHKIVTEEVVAPLRNKNSVSFAIKSAKPKEILCPVDLNNLIDQEFATSKDAHDPKRSIDDQKFLDTLNNGTTRTADGHFEMPLPFCNSNPVLPNNRVVAEKRLQGLKRKLLKDEAYKDDYCKFMTKIIDNGFAERCSNAPSPNAWYMPHHGVYHPKKKKLRVVFDASAKHAGISLNDTLLQGPDMLNGLLGVLCRFRKENVAIMCDIEQMFYQFKVIKEHRDYLRFLWWDDLGKPPAEFRMTVHLFGAKSSPGCANFGLKMAADYGEKEFGKVAADFVRNDFYVDDGLTSVSTVEEAVNLVENTQKLCAKSGIHLHKFASNNERVLEAIPKAERAEELKNLDLLRGTEITERTLGIEWSISNDAFQFKVIMQSRPPTRRGILSSVSSVYDPLGFLAPVILTGRNILQDICKKGLDWDSPLPPDIIERWESWKNDLMQLNSYKVPRCFKPVDFGDIVTVELHHFSDASTIGYGQCSYLRLIDDHNNIHCSLIIAKSRVAPVKQVTIPRLELSAAVLSVKVRNFLHRELKYDHVKEYFWTDSTVVLGYINSDAKRFHVFVANRVQQIRDSTDPKQWNYVSTENNPADCLSRGLSAERLMQNTSWLNGPAFLREIVIPQFKYGSEVSENDPELKRVSTLATTTTPMDNLQQYWLKFSSWQRLKKVIAYCLLYKQLLYWKVKKDRNLSKPTMNVELLCASEREIIHSAQQTSFSQEMKDLKDKPHSPVKERSSIHKLDPFLDHTGILRVGGRLQQSSLSPNLRHPVILPKDNHVSVLIARHIHEKSHQGRGSTMNAIRQSGYWIIGCKGIVARITHKCSMCRKLRGQLEVQKMASLPSDRTESVPPFTYCAVDFFGPFTIRIKRSDVPRYGVLFTCLTSRAIHLEVAESLDTDAFLNALRRFIAIRGPIRHLRCDRGTNFVGAKNVLERELALLDSDKVKTFLLHENCDVFEFKMNPPSASHMGGVWERQVRTVRSVLQPMMEKTGTQLDDDLLRTIFYEVMAIVNCKPLSIDCLYDPFSEVLSPNQLLTMKTKVVLPPPGNFVQQDLYSAKKWRRAQYVLNQFWSKWQAEYLSDLQKRQKWTHSHRNMAVGDIVMVKEDNIARCDWPIAIVEEVFPSSDGKVRKIKVRLADQNMNKHGVRTKAQTILERPVHKCVLLHEAEG